MEKRVVTFFLIIFTFFVAVFVYGTVANASEKSFYIKGSGIYSTLNDTEVDLRGNLRQETHNLGTFESGGGFGLSAEVGMMSEIGLFAGIEFAVRDLKIGKLVFSDQTKTDFKNAFGQKQELEDFKFEDSNIKSLMVNFGYEFDFDFFLKPYLGMGVGMSWIEDYEGTKFTQQYMLGVSYEFNPEIDIFSGYRYLTASDIEVEHRPTISLMNIDIHNFEIGVKYSF